MISKTKVLVALLYGLVFIAIFGSVFSTRSISGGDYTGINQERTQILLHYPFSAWQGYFNLGQSYVPFLNYGPYNGVIGILSSVINNTDVVERLVWWIPYLVLGTVSSVSLYKYLFPKNQFFLLVPFIFLCNSYALTILSGGQVSGIGLAYACMPLVFLRILRSFEHERFILSDSLLFALVLAIQAVFDIRIVYVSMVGIVLFILLQGYITKSLLTTQYIKRVGLFLIGPLLLVGMLHAYWLLPTVLYRQNPFDTLGSAYTTAGAVNFLSFAKIENTIGLLHPNWPENLFGKTYFMRWEFLIYPILAFSALLFIGRNTRNHAERDAKLRIVFLSLLALVGVFLAKGANDPFGGVYIWFFEHIPGFILFRDPTKWYGLIAVSYAVLIPYSLSCLTGLVKKSVLKVGFSVFVVSLLLFSLRPALNGSIGGILHRPFRDVETTNYAKLNAFLEDQPQFFRTLWLPTHQRFGLASTNHPAISGQDIFGIYDTKKLYAFMSTEEAYAFIRDAGVKYVIVPEDTLREIFLEDRKYNKAVQENAIQRVSGIPWLTPEVQFDSIHVFSVPGSTPLFRSASNNTELNWTMKMPSHYQVMAKSGTIDGPLIFAEAYSPYWQAIVNGKIVKAERYKKYFTRFTLPEKVESVDIVFIPQQAVFVGQWISAITAVIIALLFSYFKRKNV